jgi:hypothetical protein
MECPQIDYFALRSIASSTCPAWTEHTLPQSIQEAITSNGFRKLMAPATIDFDTSKYPFREDLLSALLRTNDKGPVSDRSVERLEKKKRERDIESAFQFRLSTLPLEKIHRAVDPDSSPDDDLQIPRSMHFTKVDLFGLEMITSDAGGILVELLRAVFVVAMSDSSAKWSHRISTKPQAATGSRIRLFRACGYTLLLAECSLIFTATPCIFTSRGRSNFPLQLLLPVHRLFQRCSHHIPISTPIQNNLRYDRSRPSTSQPTSDSPASA